MKKKKKKKKKNPKGLKKKIFKKIKKKKKKKKKTPIGIQTSYYWAEFQTDLTIYDFHRVTQRFSVHLGSRNESRKAQKQTFPKNEKKKHPQGFTQARSVANKCDRFNYLCLP